MAEVTQWQLAGAIEAVRDRVPIENLSSDALAKRLLAALPTGPRLADADLCASCGNQFPAGQLCDPCKRAADGEVVDAHVCCEHTPDDAELAAMAMLLPALPLVSKLGVDARSRVMDWARSRACDGLPPF